MSMHDDLQPEEFAEAATAAMTEAKGLDFNKAIQVLGEAGLFGVCAPEGDGGLGLPTSFAVPICQAAGNLRLRLPIIEQMLVARAVAGTPMASDLTSGTRTATIAWQEQPGQKEARHAAFAHVCDWVLVPDGDSATLLDCGSVDLKSNSILDPESPDYTVHYNNASVVAHISPERYQALCEEAFILTGAYLNGGAQGALEYTKDYLATRVQFGRPLTSKQAVRHHLARMKLLNEVSISAIQRALDTNEFSERRSPHAAWSGALYNALFIIEKAIHLNGGMGFTWEVPLHYALRDARRIEAAFEGSAMVQSIGRDFINAA